MERIRLKRPCIPCLIFALILGLCACSGTPSAPGTQPATERTSSVTVNISSPGDTEFRLSELPDIGRYKSKEADCFYDEPLKEFRESGKYGTIIPYCVTSDTNIPSYGFMTADGRVITAAIYSDVDTMHGKDGIVYGAAHKNFVFNEEFSELDYSKRVTDMISLDGSKLVSLSGAEPFAYPSDELIECKIYSGDIYYVGDTLLYYDFDLNLVADLSQYDIANSSLLEGDRNAWVIKTLFGDNRVMFFENGELKNTFETDGYGADVYDGVICTRSGIYEKTGKVLYSFSGEVDYDFDKTDKTLYFAESEINSVTKMKKGEVKQSRQFTGDKISNPVIAYQDGQPRLVLTVKDDRNKVSGFLILDSDLNTISRFDLPGAEFECDTWETRSVCFFTAVQNGKTEIYDLNGKLTATLPSGRSHPFFYDGCAVFTNEEDTCFIYDPSDGSVAEYENPMPGKEYGSTISLSDKFLIRSYVFDDKGVEYTYRYCLTDRTTGETLHKNISDITVTDTDSNTYISVAENGMTWVYDGDLNLVTSFLNDYYA